jgi:NhaA family Na+:H+ antiporter
MSLFIAGLAFDDQMLLDRSKIGILLASIVAGVVGYVLLRVLSSPAIEEDASSDAA